MATIIWDTIAGAELDAEAFNKRQSRTGIVKNVDVVGTSDSEVLNKVYDIIVDAVPFNTGHPSNNGSKFSRLLVRPTNVPSICRFEMIYSTATFPVTSASFLRYSTIMQSYTTRFLPGSQRHRRLAPADFTDPATGKTVKSRSIAMTLMRPIRTISVTSIIYGEPEYGDDEIVGYVNSGEWNGKQKGYWMVMGYQTDISVYQGYYTVSASVMTKGNENWFEIGTLIDPSTGLPVEVDESAVKAALTNYTYDVIPRPGFVVVGPYETIDFDATFGG